MRKPSNLDLPLDLSFHFFATFTPDDNLFNMLVPSCCSINLRVRLGTLCRVILAVLVILCDWTEDERKVSDELKAKELKDSQDMKIYNNLSAYNADGSHNR